MNTRLLALAAALCVVVFPMVAQAKDPAPPAPAIAPTPMVAPTKEPAPPKEPVAAPAKAPVASQAKDSPKSDERDTCFSDDECPLSFFCRKDPKGRGARRCRYL
jgi:hypothetical protein